MAWFRRRRSEASAEVVLSPRTERALVMLAVHAQQLDTRMERIERRLHDTGEAILDLPTHDDVLEVRLHSAKVAAELARTAVELRAEIERAASRTPELSPREQRLRTFAEQILDLSDRLTA